MLETDRIPSNLDSIAALDANEKFSTAIDALHKIVAMLTEFMSIRSMQLVEISQGATVNTDLNFQCNAVSVDNWTAQWLYIGPLRRYFPPNTGGITVPAQGLRGIQAEWAAPAGTNQPGGVAGQTAQIICIEKQIEMRNA